MKGTRVADTFPLPRSSFKLLRLILIGYLHEGGSDRKPAGPADVGRVVGLDQTIVSRNNAALGALGFLEAAEGRRWRLSDGGVMAARALEYEIGEDVQESLAAVLRPNDFVRQIATFVRGRGGVEEPQLISHIARTAGVRKTSDFLTGARALLELIYTAGLLEYDGDTVRVAPTRREAHPVETGPKPTASFGYGDSAVIGYQTDSHGRAPTVTIHLNLSPTDLKTDADADKLAARIRRLLAGLSFD
jgi:hypothetical protein